VLGSIEEARRSATVALGRIATAAGIGIVLAGLLLGLTMRRALRPLRTLANAARDAELDDLGGRVELEHRGDEIGELAREFNRMLDRLEQSVEDHRQFMASVSHELRTPVTIARGHLELLTDAATSGSPSEVTETAGLVADELKRMQRLVADLMALGRASDDDFVLPEPVSLRDFLDELQLRVVGLGTRGVRFEPVDDKMILIDRDRLAQAMLNLIVNAELHAVGHTTIVVGQTSSTAPWIGLFVRDDGAGVNRSVRDSLFEPFVKAGSSEG
ncbi:MAG: HAMP domain-containing histidine kinase, partial [Myxococcales bacterium]|nr:HAMP domain-containing histidine kinase [Myxococcales bacterium]